MNNITNLTTYYPKYSKFFDDNSKRILKFKDGDLLAYCFYFNMLNKFIKLYSGIEIITLCCIPTSKVYKESIFIPLIRLLCANNNNLHNGSKYIKTIKDRDSFCISRIRSVESFANSIEISNQVANKEILLLDDVTSTGLSMLTTKTLLLNRGAKSVDCLAIAKTYPIH